MFSKQTGVRWSERCFLVYEATFILQKMCVQNKRGAALVY